MLSQSQDPPAPAAPWRVAGRLIGRARWVGFETELAQLVWMGERAQTEKVRVQPLAKRIWSVFVPVVIVLAALTAWRGPWARRPRTGR